VSTLCAPADKVNTGTPPAPAIFKGKEYKQNNQEMLSWAQKQPEKNVNFSSSMQQVVFMYKIKLR
jgi:hypothetical protein